MPVKSNRNTKNRIFSGYFDYNLLAVVIILLCFGLVMLYSASSYEASNKFGNDLYYLLRQGVFAVAALIIALAASKIDYHKFYDMAFAAYIASIILMAMVRFTPFGITAGGAKRWLGYGILRFQPSEIAKIAIILYATALIMRLGREFYTLRGTFRVIGAGVVAGLAALFFTDNLSTGIIIILIDIFIVFVAHPKTKGFVLISIAIAVLATIALFYLSHSLENSKDFRLRRVLVWMNPEKYSDLGGYQVLQGLYAIGSGGFFGKGSETVRRSWILFRKHRMT